MKRDRSKKPKSLIKVIREMCAQCMGGRGSKGYAKRIAECASPDCPLFECRFGKNPNHTQNLTTEQRKERADRLKLARSHDTGKEKVPEFELFQ